MTVNKKPKSKQPFWLRHLFEFFRTTGLHGYKYIAMENTPIYERVCWAIALFSCMLTAVVLVGVAWDWNQSNPTLTVIESTHYAIWKYPYPAVTICSLNKVSRSTALRLSHSLVKPKGISSIELFASFKMVPAVLGNRFVDDIVKSHLSLLQTVLDLNNISFVSLIDQLTPSCREMLQRCSWKGTTTRCDTMFQRINSSEGHCCAFNYYANRKHNFPSKIAIFRPKNPRRVAGCGYQTGLSVLFKVNPDDYYSSTFGTYGVRILVHYSFDFPDENASSKLVGPGMESFLAISPEMTYSTPGIASFPIDKRNCVLMSEMKSMNFNKYTYGNCMSECRSDIVYKLCGCVPYFLPNNGSRRTCEFNSTECLFNIKSLYAASLPNINGTECKCLPDCQHFLYPVEISTGKVTRTNSYNSLNFFKEVELKNHSLAHIFFNDLVGTRYRKDVFMNWHNLLASFGGLLGLFVGFSLVSGFELIYFFTLRLFFDVAQKNNSKVNPITSNSVDLVDNAKEKWKLKKTVIGISSISGQPQGFYNENNEYYKRKAHGKN